MKMVIAIVTGMLVGCGFIFATDANSGVKSISMMLEEAQYQEETVGDVNAAISIYEKIMANEEARRPEAAKALYRYGICLVKKGDKEKAADVLKQVGQNYSDQKIFAAKAQRELDKLGQIADTGVPVVIATEPVNYAEDVPVDLNKMSVTFNQKMRNGSWAWVTSNYPYPQIVGSPSYDATLTTCSIGVKLEAGKAYMVRFNAAPYIGFRGENGIASKPYVLVFATKGLDGKATHIPEEMARFAREINSAKYNKDNETNKQVMNYDIDPNGTIYFKSPVEGKNTTSEPMERFSFINSDFVHVTKMFRDGKEIPFEEVHEGDHFFYNVKLDPPVMPGESGSGYMEGYITGLINPVPGLKDVYKYYSRHSPGGDVPTKRIETYLLPKGAKLISKTPESIQETEENGRTKLKIEEVIPAGGSIITSFEYKLGGKEAGEPNGTTGMGNPH